MAVTIRKIQKELYRFIKRFRYREILKVLGPEGSTLLDIGCQDLTFYNKLKKKYSVTLADYSPKNKLISKEDVQKLSYKNKSFDIVVCQEVLEHVPNPVEAIKSLKRVTKRQLVITVPYEPYFTFFRFLVWEKEHLWAITPKLLELYLGKPRYEKKFFFKRYYLGVWNIS